MVCATIHERRKKQEVFLRVQDAPGFFQSASPTERPGTNVDLYILKIFVLACLHYTYLPWSIPYCDASRTIALRYELFTKDLEHLHAIFLGLFYRFGFLVVEEGAVSGAAYVFYKILMLCCSLMLWTAPPALIRLLLQLRLLVSLGVECHENAFQLVKKTKKIRSFQLL
jgi:hypothetical protein